MPRAIQSICKAALYTKFNYSLLLLPLFIISTLLAVPSVLSQWVQTYNGPGNFDDYPLGSKTMAIDPAGCMYVTGWSYGAGTLWDFATVKYSPSGETLWVRRYNGNSNNNDMAAAIARDASGNIYVTGKSWSAGSYYDFTTIKYDLHGTLQWVRTYNGPDNGGDEACAVAVDAAGNIFVTGKSSAVSTGNDYATVKYSTSGVQLWVQRFDGFASIDEPSAIAVDAFGNVYVTGRSTTPTQDDYCTIKYDAAGVQEWMNRYNGPGGGGNNADWANAIAVDAFGNVFVTGWSFGNVTGSGNPTTVKYSTVGNEEWVQRYPEAGGGIALAVDNQNNVYATGWCSGIDYVTIKYSASGQQDWSAKYNGPGNSEDYPSSIAVDAWGNVYVTGYSRSGIAYGTEDIATIKYDHTGTQKRVLRYDGPANSHDYGTSVALDNQANIYVSGYSTGNGSEFDYTVLKYFETPPTGLEPVGTIIPEEYSLEQNYPNPFNPSTVIRFRVPHSSGVKLTVYDAAGKVVSTFVDEELNPGIYAVSFSGSNLSSGVYYYSIRTADYFESRKMLLVK